MSSSVSLQLLESVTPALVALAAALLFLAWRLYRRPAGSAETGRVTPLAVLRVASIALVVFLLLEPVLAMLSERNAPPRIALLFDGSASMSIPFPEGDETASAAARTRSERMAMAVDESDLVDRLGREGGVEAYRFGGAVTPLVAKDQALDLEPREDRTDLARAMRESVAPMRQRTGAVVLLSDGSQNVGADPRAEARRLGVPVFAVGVGSEGPVTDLTVSDVVASSVSYLDNVVPVVARVRARGDSALGVTVVLSEGEAVLDSARVDLPGGGVEVEVELEYTPDREGLHRYRVWTPVRDDELSGGNNERLFAVRVLKEKIQVMLVAGRPSFDLTFLKRALESDVSLDVKTVILSLERFPGTAGRRGPAFPDDYAELAQHDLVILLDAGPGALGDERLSQVARFVNERGGALLIMGPPRAFELAGTPLQDLLPFLPEAPVRELQGQILPRLTVSGRTHPVTSLDGDPETNERLWSGLPPLGVAPLLPRPRAEARVLVQGEMDGIPRRELPLVAVTQAGRGRVLSIAGSPFWRWDLYLWGTGRSGDLFRRFVTRGVRWLVARDELKQVMVRPAQNLFDGAESVVIEGQVYDDDFRPIEGADVRATVRGPLGTEPERPREISLVDAGGGRYRAVLPGLPPGDYAVEGTASLGGTELGQDAAEMTVAPYRMEFEDAAPNFALLRELARESGGRFLPLAELASLPAALDLEPVVERSVREWPFLESPLLFLALLALLGTEWALRRGRGMP